MRKYLSFSILLIITLIAGILYGFLIHMNKIFPYRFIKKTYFYFAQKNSSQWSIGIYEGTTPFNLADPPELSNPVLSGDDVDDIDASFVADPFMLIKNGKYFMFFEVMNRESYQGDIGYAESVDGEKWNYRKIIIDEKFHLSYPYIFEWDSSYYLIPESSEDLSVRLYKAISFPEKWKYIGNLLSGYPYTDPSIFRYKDKWWMFVSSTENNVLNLYYSENLSNGWIAHPMNPIVNLNKTISRPGGRVFVYNDKLYRLTQNDYPYYGIQVFAVEITKLSEEFYEEETTSKIPIVSKTGNGWNGAGMHNVDLHKVKNKWISPVDGLNKNRLTKNTD
jgi:hypothetical protein